MDRDQTQNPPNESPATYIEIFRSLFYYITKLNVKLSPCIPQKYFGGDGREYGVNSIPSLCLIRCVV